MLNLVKIPHIDRRIGAGYDSIVFDFPDDPGSILKVYPSLTLRDLRTYHHVHRVYAQRGSVGVLPSPQFLKYAQQRNWKNHFLGQEIRGAVVYVLDLGEDIAKVGVGVTSRIRKIPGKNLAEYFNLADSEELQLSTYIVEDMVHTGLELIGAPIEKRKPKIGIIKEGHVIGRDNIMISGVSTSGIIEVVITDLGLNIPHALRIEEKNGNLQSS